MTRRAQRRREGWIRQASMWSTSGGWTVEDLGPMPGVGRLLALLGAAPVTGLVTAHALYGPYGVVVGVYAGAGASLVPLTAAAVIGYRASVDDPPATVGPQDAWPPVAPDDAHDDAHGDADGPDGADVVPLARYRTTARRRTQQAGFAPTGTEAGR